MGCGMRQEEEPSRAASASGGRRGVRDSEVEGTTGRKSDFLMRNTSFASVAESVSRAVSSRLEKSRVRAKRNNK